MTTVAIVGAGPGVGLAVARRFSAAGHAVALISRTQANVDALAATLPTARGFAADVGSPAGLATALDEAAEALGPIEILQYSPIPHHDFLQPVASTRRATLRTALDFSLFGLHAAAEQVLPDMRALGRGTIVLINGGSAARPRSAVAGTSVAFAAAGAYAEMLHTDLAPENIHVTQLIVPGAIRDDDPITNAPRIADHVWTLHTTREGFRHFHTPM